MNEEELRELAKEELNKAIMNNLDSTLIFTYIKRLEEENRQLKFDCKQAEDLKHLFMEERDKLQKENETLKEENFDQVYMKAIADYKEKIRNKIKDLDLIDEYDAPNGWESEREYAKDILKELLKEE